MADDVLTPAELEILLSASQSGRAAQGTARSRTSETWRAAMSPQDAIPQAPIGPHEFRRQRVVDDDQLQTVWTLHERFAAGIREALSAMLRCRVDAKLTSVDQLSYGELLRGLENPTCVSILRAQPLGGEMALDVNPSILFPIIDRLLGGGGEPSPTVRRPLTAIEMRLASRVSNALAAELRRAWHDVVEMELSVDRLESDPHAAQIVLPAEGVVRIRIELTIPAARGLITLCLPAVVLRPIAAQLSSSHSVSGTRHSTCPQTAAQAVDAPHTSPVQLVAQLAATRVTAGDVLDLRVGDIITTGHNVSRPLEVRVDGVVKFAAQPGVLQGVKAVQIDESFEPDDCRPSSP